MVALNISEEIHTLADFTQNSAEFIEQLEETGEPVILTVNGKAKVIIQDADAYRRMLDLVDRMEMHEGIRISLESMRQGKGRPAEVVFEELRRKYNIPSKEEFLASRQSAPIS